MGQGAVAADVDLASAPYEKITSAGELQVDRDGTLHGLACWFDCLLSPGVIVHNMPPRGESSWSHGFLPLAEAIEVSAGDRFRWELSVSADGEDWNWELQPVEG